MKNFHILKYGPIIGLPHFNLSNISFDWLIIFSDIWFKRFVFNFTTASESVK